jgi:hypothetical protein
MSRVSLLRVPRVALVALDAAADPVLKEFRGRFIGKASPVLG